MDRWKWQFALTEKPWVVNCDDAGALLCFNLRFFHHCCIENHSANKKKQEDCNIQLPLQVAHFPLFDLFGSEGWWQILPTQKREKKLNFMLQSIDSNLIVSLTILRDFYHSFQRACSLSPWIARRTNDGGDDTQSYSPPPDRISSSKRALILFARGQMFEQRWR